MELISRLIYSRGVKRTRSSFTTLSPRLIPRRDPKGETRFYPSVASGSFGSFSSYAKAAGVIDYLIQYNHSLPSIKLKISITGLIHSFIHKRNLMAENSADIAKRIILNCVAEGMTVEQACASAGKSMKTYEYYRRTDKVFSDKVDRTRLGLREKNFASDDTRELTFAEFRQRFLHNQTFPHQQNLVDVIEGRDPSWLHPSMKYEKGLNNNRILLNIPPNHAKSITITVDYVTWLLCQNPNFRVLIVSQTQRLAGDFLYAIKQRLTHPMYEQLQAAYAAGVGFKSKSASWQATRVTFGDELRESSEKDPNLEAVGIGGQIYGKRADMIIVDDAVTLSNANDFERQIKWLTQDVRSRLNPTGKLIIIGTRVASVDLYKELRNPDRYPGGLVPWTYLAMPALLESNEDPDKWTTLWPASDQPFDGQEEADKNEEGLYPRWSGRNLFNERQSMDASTWALIYQQQDISDDAVFDPVCVRGSIDGMRKSGPLNAGYPGHPKDMQGFTFICGLDPAMVGDTAAVCYAIDRTSHKRYIVDVIKITRPTPAQIRQLIFDWTEIYKPSEWIVERNAFQSFLTQDEGIRQHLATRGVILREHHTGNNKWDAGFGVASMSTLFGTKQADGKHHRDNLIKLPSDQTENVKSLIEQLITWSPTTKGKTDMVMALWFCEIRAREMINYGQYQNHHMKNPFLSNREKSKRMVINIDELLLQKDKTFV